MAEQQEVKIEIHNLCPGVGRKRTIYYWPAREERESDRQHDYDKILKEAAFIVVNCYGRYSMQPTNEVDSWPKKIRVEPFATRHERIAKAIAEHVQSSDETLIVAKI